MMRCNYFKTTRFFIYTLILRHNGGAWAFRIAGSENEAQHFVPYEEGFVGKTADPQTYGRERVNQGYASHVASLPRIAKHDNRLQSCPGMVGPTDEKFYCRGKEFGYCDRRSGTCFCNGGYEGLSCELCSPSYIMIGSLCYPKKHCPIDCSGAGTCDHLTGICECNEYREGIDCSQPICSKFHEYCTHCNDDTCVACIEGYSVDESADEGNQCEPCSRFDPRCKDCDSTACLACTDLLLTSIRRSGKRKSDGYLPIDELERELSSVVPFGSQQMDAFDEAEHYFVVDPPLSPLNASSLSCDQGTSLDSSFSCQPIETFNIVCGNHGTVTFRSPQYEVWEDGRHIRLSIQRTGGGVGTVSVFYDIHHISTDDSDVTPTAFYTTNQTIIFYPGQIRKSFLITIHDDRLKEKNETFSVALSSPTGGATLGNQWTTTVTIIDDDSLRTCSDSSHVMKEDSDHMRYNIAGEGSAFSIQAKSCSGEEQIVGGDEFKVVATKYTENGRAPFLSTDRVYGSVHDEGNGRHACELNITEAGKYDLNIFDLIPGGLMGNYYHDPFLSSTAFEKSRVDAVINFTWAEGRVTSYGRDFVSVRWEGFVLAREQGWHNFWLETEDNVRMWIDGTLLIDEWGSSPSGLSVAAYNLVAGETYEISIEYRELVGPASIKLMWSSEHTASREVIPASLLYYKEHLGASPLHYTVIAAKAHAQKSRAFGPGLYQGVAGKEHRFTITPIDAYGNFRGVDAGFDDVAAFHDKDFPTLRSRDGFHAVARLIANDDGIGAVEVPVDIIYDQTIRKYDAKYWPTISGTYAVSVTLSSEFLSSNVAGSHIYGSPFTVTTSPGLTFAPESEAYGGNGNCIKLDGNNTSCPGIQNGLAGFPSTFFIQSLDAHRNRRGVGGDAWKIVLHDENGEVIEGTVQTSSLDGLYSATVTPVRSGQNVLSIMLDGVHAKGSPFEMIVRHGDAYGPSCFLVGNLASMTITATITNVLIVQTVDEWGNFLITNEQPYDTEVIVYNTDPFGKVTSSQTTMIGDGTFQILYIPDVKGNNTLSVQVNGEQIDGSPFEIDVVPGRAIASGPGLVEATAGDEASFVILEQNGNNRTSDGANFSVALAMKSLSYRPPDYDTMMNNGWGSNATLDGYYTQVGHGKYVVKYNATISGTYIMNVTSNGKHIVGSPFSVQVFPAATSAWHSTVTGVGTREGTAGKIAPIRIYARDRYGNFVMKNQDHFTLRWTLMSRHQQDWESNSTNDSLIESKMSRSGSAEQVAVYSGGSGMYLTDFVPHFSGKYILKVGMYQPGGLVGRYYSTPYFESVHLAFVVSDEVMNKTWEFGGPSFEGSSNAPRCKDVDVADGYHAECFENDGPLATTFAVEWSGKLLAAHNEEYTIYVDCDEGGSAEIYIKEEEVLPWHPCHKSSGSVVLSSVEYKDIRIRYRKENVTVDGGDPFFFLKWSSPSSPGPAIIAKDFLYNEVLASGRGYNSFISPNDVVPSMSTVAGTPPTQRGGSVTALSHVIAGVRQRFVVECRDGFGNGLHGNLLLTGGSHVYAFARSGHHIDDPSFEGTVFDNVNGTYTVEYLPIVSGIYTLSVTVRDDTTHGDLGYFARDLSTALAHVQGSPFLLTVEPSSADPLGSHLHMETEIESVVGSESAVMLHVRDEHGNLRDSGGDKVLAYLLLADDSSGKEENPCIIVDNKDGTYNVMFTPFGQAGSYRLHVMIAVDDGEIFGVQGSPYNVTVHPGNTDALHTHIISGESFRSTRGVIHDGTVWAFSSDAGNRREFEVIAKDKFGNPVNRGGDSFFAKISGNTNISPEERLIDVIDMRNGKYTFAYTVSLPGQYKADIAFASQNGLVGQYFPNRHLDGEPLVTQLDERIDFAWGDGAVVGTSLDFSSIRWTGYMSFPDSGLFTFEVMGETDRAILWIDGSLIADTELGGKGTFSCKGNVLYSIRLEFFEATGTASISLLWSSHRMALHIVPSKYLFETVSPILGSPFEVIVT